MKTLVDCLLCACFFAMLILFQGWQDSYKIKLEQARLDGVTAGAKAVSLKCGTVSGYINTGAVK